MKYFILTLGCQMNKSDSERIARILEDLNYKKVDDEKSADLIVVNSCSVRQSAVDRIFGKTRVWNREKIRRCESSEPPLITILTGCVLPQDRRKFEKIFDLIFNIKDLKQLSEKLRIYNLKHKDIKKIIDYKPQVIKYFNIRPIYQTPWSAFVPIMTGCDNFCSYCAVPYTRGREASRSVKEILDEIIKLVKNGCLEIVLLGQNVNAYSSSNFKIKRLISNIKYPISNNDQLQQFAINCNKLPSITDTGDKHRCDFSKNNPYRTSFAALLWEINQISELNRIHFTAPHPKDMNDEIIDALTLPRYVNYLHLPIQSGDDEILKRMNRRHTVADYIKLIKKIKKKKPNIALGTDIIVGFPGETKKQFNNTVGLYKEIQFDISYIARYSPRPGTAAAKLRDNVSYEEKKRRWRILQELMKDITLKKNQRYVGQRVEVLVDKVAKREKSKRLTSGSRGLYEGNSREYKRVRFCSERDLLGRIIKVKIKKAMTWMLEGEIAKY